jgi:hypothetical protein
LLKDLALHAEMVIRFFFMKLNLDNSKSMKCGLSLKKQKKVKLESPNSDKEGDAWIFNFMKRKSYGGTRSWKTRIRNV